MSVLAERIALMVRLGQYFEANNENWQYAKDHAERMNGWFTQAFIELAVKNITHEFLSFKNFDTSSVKRKIADMQATIDDALANQEQLF